MGVYRIQVAVPGPFYQPLTYLSAQPLKAGVRVRVPLRSRKVIGVVMGEKEGEDTLPEDRLKPIQTVLDSEPALTPAQLAFMAWLARYYHAPVGEVLQLFLPQALREGQTLWRQGVHSWRLTQAGRQADLETLARRAVRQRRLLRWFQQHETGSVSALRAWMPDYRAPLKKLEEKGWLEAYTKPCLEARALPALNRHPLNKAQAEAVERVAPGAFAPVLLQGMTGSGKTAVYLSLAEKVIAQGQQVLVLVPEIGLTPQMVQRFEAWLQQPVAVLHSGLNASERHCAWTQLAKGNIQVALGTRSALLSRFQNLGLIVVDEEHDPSYKQQEGVRYSARDAAVWLAKYLNIPVVLGSATPSMETLQHARSGRYQHLKLHERAGGAKLPRLKLLDIRGETIQEGVSRPLYVAMQQHLSEGHQVMLFLNRRGFAPVLMCHHCGWQADCPACSTHLTYHAQPSHLHCHHCDYQRPVPERCPNCGSGTLMPVGQGTARLETVLQQSFQVPVVRIDRDSTRKKGALDAQLARVQEGKPMILLGTQMLAKGHHFPQVTLVGMLEVDQRLFSPDFRAPERLAQQVIQVAGRAGRGEHPGEVLIETRQPEHPLLQVLVKKGYEAFSEQELAVRQSVGLPPFQYQALIRAQAHEREAGLLFLQQLLSSLTDTEVEAWGPASAPMIKRQGYWRYQLLLQSKHRARLHRCLDQLIVQMHAMRQYRVRWSVDVDPQDMY